MYQKGPPGVMPFEIRSVAWDALRPIGGALMSYRFVGRIDAEAARDSTHRPAR